MISPKAITLLEEAISTAVGHAVAISLGDGEISSVTPWQIEQQRFADLLQQAREDLASEPDVQFLIERFGAQLDAASIQPLKH
jgi:DNA polymerase-3 subunit gamma/tau